MASACVLLANGFEEIEAITVIDVLRRAGVDCTTIGVGTCTPKGSHDIPVGADVEIDDVADDAYWDVVVLPGGLPGATNLRDDARVQALVRRQHERGGSLAAICAGPIALAKAGVLAGRRVTSYPGFAPQLGEVEYLDEAVVTDGTIVTSRGPGTAMAFALALVERLRDPDVARDVGARMLVR
jgi:4-methyl-5(b-hydroxyethyl)-thiazole monophosphate biosynthesis